MSPLTCFAFAGLGMSLPCLVAAGEPYSPYVDRGYPANVYWGDTHLHSNQSLDANGVGNRSLSPDDAYRFAKGNTVIAQSGQAVRLSRPLDFLVVADHAENLGVLPRLEAGDSRLLSTEAGKRWFKLMQDHPVQVEAALNADTKSTLDALDESIFRGDGGYFWKGFRGAAQPCAIDCAEPEGEGHIGDESFRRSVWVEATATAQRHNEPGRFTTLSGFEWTSGSIHRVVIFKDGPEKTDQVLPFSRIDSEDPEDLWKYMNQYQELTGGEVLAIPHNGNTSNGKMFARTDFRNRPFDADYARRRSRWEPIYEVTQIKGDGEAHPILSPDDEFADFETWNSWNGWTLDGVTTEGWEARKAGEYARSALKLGLRQQAESGENPFKFGLIGSTDAHTSLAAVGEDNFFGKMAIHEPSPYRLTHGPTREASTGLQFVKWEFAASGYAAVWATENTRQAIFAAMKRKETFATTGPRITVRFFGGWMFKPDDHLRPNLAGTGYAKGVPMGGDLSDAPQGRTPQFLIGAMKDPAGANLDRVQIIKGWRSSGGELNERVYDVALSDDRQPGPDGKVPPVGNTVDISRASYTNAIGDPVLTVVWTDPDFDRDELAFYYVRVLEIPTPRWTAYDADVFAVQDFPIEIPMIIRERAYTSPIWYTP